MSSLKKIVLIGVAVMLVLVTITRMYETIKKQKADIERLERNYEAANAVNVEYKTKLGNSANKKQALELSIKELKSTNKELYKEVDALKVRVKDALSVTRTITKTEIDTIVKTDTVNKYIVAEYKDPWNTIQAKVGEGSARLNYIGTDTITGVISIKRKKFLFFRWGVKRIEYDITNKNPKTKIHIDTAVKLK